MNEMSAARRLSPRLPDEPPRHRTVEVTSWHRVKQGFIPALALILFATPAFAQSFGPAHNNHATAGPTSGGIDARPAFNRRLLGIINNSSNVVYCTVDGTDASADHGLRFAAAGTTGDRILFDRQVPQGPVRCYSATGGSSLLIIEGR